MPRLIASCVHQCRLFFIALQFFTRSPIPRWVGFAPEWQRHASRYLPLVGVLVAAVCAAVHLAAARLWPAPVAALLATGAGIYLTGAFHEDGFADMCDGFGGGMTRERILDIMKDSRIGAYGAIGIGGLLALKVTLLSQLAPGMAGAALFLAHPLSRVAASALIWRLDYARAEGKAKLLAQEMSGGEFGIAASTGALPALIMGLCGYLPWSGMLAGVLGAALASAWLARGFVRRLGGYTGDCLGAVQQVSEVTFYLALTAGVWR